MRDLSGFGYFMGFSGFRGTYTYRRHLTDHEDEAVRAPVCDPTEVEHEHASLRKRHYAELSGTEQGEARGESER